MGIAVPVYRDQKSPGRPRTAVNESRSLHLGGHGIRTAMNTGERISITP
jgi:hypothetical protein